MSPHATEYWKYKALLKDNIAWLGKYNVGLKKILQRGISETEFYGDSVYKVNG